VLVSYDLNGSPLGNLASIGAALSYGSQLVVNVKGHNAHIPKSLIEHAANASTNRARTPDLLQLVTNVVKRQRDLECREGTKDETTVDPLVVPLAAAIGFVIGVASESSAIRSLITPRAVDFRVHGRLLNFTQDRGNWLLVFSSGMVTCCLVIVTFVLLSIEFPNHVYAVGTCAGLSLMFAGLTIFVWWRERLLVTRGMTPSELVTSYVETHMFPQRTMSYMEPLLLPAHRPTTPVPPLSKELEARITIPRHPKGRPNLKGPQLNGFVVASAMPHVVESSHVTEELGLLTRTLQERPLLADSTLLGMSRVLQGHLDSPLWTFQAVFGELYARPVLRMPFEKWLNRFPRSQANRMRAAWKLFNSNPTIPTKEDCRRKSFVKREKLPYKEGIKPRMIQGTTDLANVILGPFIAQLHKDLKQVWNMDHFICDAGSFTPDQVGEWVQFNTLAFLYENDFEKFDASQLEPHHKEEEKFYARLGADKYEQAVLRHQRRPTGSTASGIKYKVNGGRCSGDPNTSLGNTIENALTTLAVFYDMFLEIGIELTPANIRSHFRMLVLSDDSIIACSHKFDTERIAAKFMERNLRAKVKIHVDSDYVEFCSAYAWWCKRKHDGALVRVKGPKIERILFKLGVSVGPPQGDPIRWLAGVCVGVRDDYAFLPVARAWVSRMLQLAREQGHDDVEPIVDHETKHTTFKYEICDETWMQFTKIYGVTRDEALALEDIINSAKDLHTSFSHPVLDKMVAQLA